MLALRDCHRASVACESRPRRLKPLFQQELAAQLKLCPSGFCHIFVTPQTLAIVTSSCFPSSQRSRGTMGSMPASSGTVRRFEALIEKAKTQGLGWTVTRLPFTPADVWPQMIRLRVCGSVNGVPFRTSLFPDPDKPGGYLLLVTRATQQAAHVTLGSRVTIDIEPDLQPRLAELPDELDALLDEAEGLRDWYDSLSEYTRREIGKWVQGVKSDEARLRRAQQMAERMLYTMEAEQELPPAIARALQSRPKARAGWAKMTPTQRRMELFGVAYYQSPESQIKRIAKLCDVAEKRML